MNKLVKAIWVLAPVVWISGCHNAATDQRHSADQSHGAEAAEADVRKGPHGGRLLADGSLAVELSIFEAGAPPEFRVWATDEGVAVTPEDIDLRVTLTRLGGKVDEIRFAPQDDFLRGDTVIYEPHSFAVSVEARYRGSVHRWQYDSFEGRTRIGAEVAEVSGLETMIAGPETIKERITVYGRIVPNPERTRAVSARFDGVIQSVSVSVGDSVRPGQVLAVVESNESLNTYEITAPIGGVVTSRKANSGEQTAGRQLFTIIDTSSVWAELAVFPSDHARVKEGAAVTVSGASGGTVFEGAVSRISTLALENQAVTARVTLENTEGELVPGMHVTGAIQVAEHSVPLAVKRSGLQSFRDFTVVYAQIGDEYEVRMLDLGRQNSEWVEVLGGLDPGTRYVTKNSFLVKADIEKSGAAHDH